MAGRTYRYFTGKVARDEVVRLCLEFPDVPGVPIRALRSFQRIHLSPGASQIVRFHLKQRDLSMVTEVGDRIVAQGRYTLSIGGDQPGAGAVGQRYVSGEGPNPTAAVEIAGRARLPAAATAEAAHQQLVCRCGDKIGG